MKNITPLQQLVLYILKFAQTQGKDNLSKFQIMKLVYLVESEYRRYVGEPFISEVKFQRDENGPISVDVYNAIDQLSNQYISVTETHTNGYPHPRACHKLINSDGLKFSYSKEQMAFLNCILNDYINLTQSKLKDIAYETEPMLEIQEIEKEQNKKVIGYQLNMNNIPLDPDILEGIVNTSQ